MVSLFSLLPLVVSEPWVEVGAVPGAASQPPLGAPVVPRVAGSPCALALPGPFGDNAAHIKRYDQQSDIYKSNIPVAA